MFAIRNVAKYSAAVFDKPANALHDWEIFSALGDRVASRMDVSPVPTFLPEQILEMGLQSGPYGAMSQHSGSKGSGSKSKKADVGLSLAKLKQHPEGVDLGAHEPLLPERLCTDDKKIRLAPKELVEDLQRLLSSTTETTAGRAPFLLIGRRHVRSNNSWMHNSLRLVKGKPRHQLMLNTKDAVALGVVNEDQVEVVSRVGSVKVNVDVTDTIMPGVVSLPHGWGHHRKGVKLAIAQEHAGVSANDLTDELFLDQLSGNAALSGVPVEVKPCK